jgi:nucleotide-binding universal stress UspA family protein
MSPAARISRLLVGVDFEEASGSALKMAGVLASTWDAELTVVHSATEDVPAYFTAAQLEALEAEREQSRDATTEQVRAFAGRHVTRAVHVVVDAGPPADAMLRRAASFDLVVVGTHRRHGARRWWLGSVAEALVRQSPRPVLVVPAGAIVPEAGRPLRILDAGGDVAEAEAWVDVFKGTFGGGIVRAPDLQQCAPDRLENTDLVVLSLATAADSGTQARFRTIVQVLKECVHPVLFVPSADGMFERSSS